MAARGEYMKSGHAGLVSAAAAALGWGMLAAASAAPPTVTPSPGYDARLQEQRAAQNYRAPAYQGFVRHRTPAHRHRHRRMHDGH
jgi:hypothetical protein